MKNIKEKGKNIKEKGKIFKEIIDTGWADSKCDNGRAHTKKRRNDESVAAQRKERVVMLTQ